jgi:phage/plasmid-like protein (TIGR03299 family)
MNMSMWNEVGTKIALVDDLTAAMKEANVLFNVRVIQGYFINGGGYTSAEGFYYIVRDDLNIALGTCKSRFSPLQNHNAFDLLRPLIEDGTCTLDTIGKFGVGEKVWALAKINTDKFTVVPGDEVEFYLFIINAHDGSSSVKIGITPIRVVCSNMFSMLGANIFKVRHTGDIDNKVGAGEAYIETQMQSFMEYTIKLRSLTDYYPTPEELEKYFRAVFEIPKDKSTRGENKIKQLKQLFVLGRGLQGEQVRGTWYAAFNAVTEYLNYEYGRSAETRMYSLLFGASNLTGCKALKLATDFCLF